MLEGFDPNLEWLPERQALRVGVGDDWYDVALGPMTDMGASYEVLTSGHYRFNVGASIIASEGVKNPKEPWKRADPRVELKSPFETMKDAVRISALSELPLSLILMEGADNPMFGAVAGSALMYGPGDTEVSRQEMASRIPVKTTGNVFMSDALRQVRAETQRGIGEWSHLQAYYPHNQDDNVIRLVKQPYNRGINERGDAIEPQYLSARGAVDKDIKGRNVIYNYRQTVGLFQQNNEGRILPLKARDFTEQGIRPQWAKGNLVLPGETRARSSVMLNEFIGAAPFMSGAGAIYSNLLEHTGAHSVRRISDETIDLPFENIDEFNTARIRMNKPFKGGVIKAGTSREVGRIYYRRNEDIIGSLYGSGQAITTPGEKATEEEIKAYNAMVKAYKPKKDRGYLDYGDFRYNVTGTGGGSNRQYTFTPEESVYRINVNARAGDVAINSATLMMPRGFNIRSGELSAFSEGADFQSTQALADERMAEFRSSGLSMRRTGGDLFSLQLSTFNSVAGSLKVAGGKVGYSLLEGLNDWGGRIANIAGKNVNIDLYNPETKSLASRMIGAINAMTRKQQINLLSLVPGGGELAIKADQEFAGRKLNMDRLAGIYGTTPYELASDLLTTIINEKDENRQKEIMHLTGIGVGETRVPYLINNDMIDYYKNYITENADAMGYGDKKLFGKGGMVQFEKYDKGGRDKTLMTIQTRGIFMRTASQFVSEDPGRAVTNFEMMRAIRVRYSGAASFLGLGVEQGWDAPGAEDPATDAMQQIARSHAYNLSSYSDAGARIIGPEEAQELSSKIAGITGKTEVEKTKELQRILGDQPLRFQTLSSISSADGVSGQIFSPKAALSVDAEVMGTSITKMSQLYNNTIKQMLDAEATGDPEEAYHILSGQRSPYGKMQTRIARMIDTGNKLGKGTKNRLNARTSPGSIGGRYALMEGLNANEIYLPDDQIKRMLRDGGVKGDAQLKKAMAQINERGYLPAFFLRQPVLSAEYGAPPVRIVTRDILAKRGNVLPDDKDPFTKDIAAFVPTNIVQGLAGDYDFDPASIIGAFRWKKGKLAFADDVDEEMHRSLLRSNPEILKDTQLALQNQFGTQAGEFDIHNDSVKDWLEAMFTDKGYPFKTAQVQWREQKDLYNDAERQIRNVTGMGTAYSARRRLEAAAYALGTFKEVDIVSNMDKMTKLYQQYLDKTRGQLTNLEHMFSSVYLEGDGRSIFMNMKRGPASDQWQRMYHSTTFSHNVQGNVVQALAEDYFEGKQPLQSGSMAFMLSTGSEQIETLKAIIENADSHKDPDKLATELMGAMDKSYKGTTTSFADTPFGVSLMSEAIQRSYRTTIPNKDVLRSDALGTQPIFWGKDNEGNLARSIDQLAMSQQIGDQRVMYTALASKRVLLPEEINRMARLTERTGGFLPWHISSQFNDWNTEMSQSVSETAEKTRISSSAYLMERAPIQMNASAIGELYRIDPTNVNGLRAPGDHATRLADAALSHISQVLPGYKNITQLKGEPLTRGNLVEKAWAGQFVDKKDPNADIRGVKTTLGYYIGDKDRLHEYATTPDGRYVRITGVPDFVGVNDDGIVISDMKSSSRTDLATDETYKTQLNTYAQLMTSLARKEEGREFLKGIFSKWGFNADDITKAIEHAKEKRITGQIAQFGADITPGMTRGLMPNIIDMGDMYEEGIGQKLIMGSENILKAVPGAVDMIASMAVSGRSFTFGGGPNAVNYSLAQQPSFVTRMANDARRMLNRHGKIEPELRAMMGGHATARDNPEDVTDPDDIYGSGVTGHGTVTPKITPNEVRVPETSMRADEAIILGPGGNPQVVPTLAGSNSNQASMLEDLILKLGAGTEVNYNQIKNPFLVDRLQNVGANAAAQLNKYAPDLHAQVKQAMGRHMKWSPEQIENASMQDVIDAAFSDTGEGFTRPEMTEALRPYKQDLQIMQRLQDQMTAAYRSRFGISGSQESQAASKAVVDLYEDTGDVGGKVSELRQVLEGGKGLGIFTAMDEAEKTTKKYGDAMADAAKKVEDWTKEFEEDIGMGVTASKADQIRRTKNQIGDLSIKQQKLQARVAEYDALELDDDRRDAYDLQLKQTTGELTAKRARLKDLEENKFKRAGRGAGSALRRLFGGFSLMWMGSMFGWGMENMTEGVAEADQMRLMSEQQALALGMGGDLSMSAAVAQQRSLLSGGGIVGKQMAIDWANIKSGATGGMIGAAKTGLGFFAGGMFAAEAAGVPALLESLGVAGTGGGAAATAGIVAPIAGIAAMGALAYQGSAYARNPEDTTMAIALAEQQGNKFSAGWISTLAEIGETINGPSRDERELFQKEVQQYGYIEATRRSSQRMNAEDINFRDNAALLEQDLAAWNQIGAGTQATQATGILGNAIGGISGTTPTVSGKFSDAKLAEYYALRTEKFNEYDPGLVMQTRLRAQAGGIFSDTNMEKLLKAQAAGVDPWGYGRAMTQAMGLPMTVENTNRFAIQVPLTEEDALEEQRGMQIMQGLVGTSAFGRLFGGMTEDQKKEQIGKLSQLSRTENYDVWNQQINLASQLRGYGIELPVPAVEDALGWTQADRNQIFAQNMVSSRGANISASVMGMTGNFALASGMGNAGIAGGALGMRAMENLVNFNPTAMAQFAQAGTSPALNNVTTRQIRQTYDANGNALGMASLPLFTMDMGIGNQSPMDVANAVFGANWEGSDTYGLRNAAMTGGFRGMQTEYNIQSAALSGASAGIAMRGAELSYAFQTGIGLGEYGTVNPVTGKAFNLPSGGFWGIQDKQRDLSHAQQMWSFQYQQESMDMQRSQFYENQALNRRGSLMNRSFTRRGWEFEDQVTDLQWGWQQEDFAEESRFMVGRQRKKAETQMERATIMHELQTNRTDELRSQQEELWDLEDERFKMTREHFEEQMDLQEENFEKMQEFYEERKKLEDQMQELQRAYFIEQNKLQKESAGIQAAMAALQRDMAENQKKMNEYLEDQAARQEYVKTTGDGVADMWDAILEKIKDSAKDLADILNMDLPDGGGWDGNYGWTPEGPPTPPVVVPDPSGGGDQQAWGTQGYKVVPGMSGEPYNVTLHGGEMYDVKRRDEVSNPWNDETISFNGDTRGSGGLITQTVIVKIGEHEIRDYIVDTVQMEM